MASPSMILENEDVLAKARNEITKEYETKESFV